MSLIMRVGNAAFLSGAVGYVPRITAKLNSRGVPVARVLNIDLDGDLFFDGPAANMAGRLALERLQGVDRLDFSIVTDRGIQILRYNASDALRGMTMTNLQFPNPNDGQLVTLSTFRMMLEGEFAVPTLTPGDTLEYTESISEIGEGDSQYGWMKPINTRPVSFLARKYTTKRFVQKGQSVGFKGYPRRIPKPFVTNPKFYMQNDTLIDRGSPSGPGLSMYPITWQYFFEFDIAPRNIFPTPWPAR